MPEDKSTARKQYEKQVKAEQTQERDTTELDERTAEALREQNQNR